MRKPMNKRRAVLRDLRVLKASITWLIARWDVTGRVLLDKPERRPDGTYSHFRGRRKDEYPENDPVRWEELGHTLQEISDAAGRLAYAARIQALRMRDPELP